TRALWRFDGGVTANRVSCVASGSCPTNGFCATWEWTYQDPNNSSPMTTGSCVYDSNCPTSSTGTLISGTPPIGLAACPATNPNTGAIFAADGTNHFPVYPGTNAVATFNGTTQFSSATYSGGTWDLGATYTLSAWFKTASAASMRILSEQDTTGAYGGAYWGFGVSGGGVRRFDSRDTGQASRDITMGSGLNDGNWHQIHVVRVNGSTVRLYADGALLGTSVVNSTSSFASHPIRHPVLVGKYEGGGELFNGTIDEIRVTDVPMTDDDVYLEYNGSAHHKYSSNSGASYTQSNGAFAGAPANATTALVIYSTASGEAYSATGAWIFEAQSTQSASTVLSPYVPVIDTGKPVAPALTGVPTTTNDITWSWGTPGKVCQVPTAPYFQLIDAVSGAAITPANTLFYPADTSAGENIPGTPNQLRSRHLVLTDTWGTSSLSASATAYTLAAAPASLSFTNISTGSFTASWSANGNPGYTRYEVSYARDAGFTVGLTTRAALTDDLTATSVGVGGLATGTTYYLRVRAYNGRASDAYGGAGTAYLSGTFVTVTGAPTLAGAPLSNASVQWSWSTVPGANGYTLYDYPSNAVIVGPGAARVSTTTVGLSPNTRYDAEVEATMPAPTPTSPRGHAFTYTLANPPTATAVAAVFPSSAAVAWNANGNPAGTFYSVVVASDAAFAVIVATISVTTTTAYIPNLLPGATYYSKVQAVNGVQIPTAYTAIPNAKLPQDPSITSNASPNTPYAPATGLVGAWQFDESSGTFSLDGSTYGNSANLVCATNGCTSTPTWTSGPNGLGAALAFTGLNGAALTASGAPFSFTDSLTVEAWVNPVTAAQQNNAGIVGRGNLGAEDFALDVNVGKFRFLSSPSKVATSPAVLTPGVWTHLAGVYDSAAQTTTLYVNGAAVASVGLAAPPRNDSGQVLSIGNRPNALGAEALAFAGSIDSVRVLRRALTSAEVLSDYQGGFVSTVTPAGPNAGILVALPPNAFGTPAQILISADPVGHPIKIPAAALDAGLADLPAGLTLVPNTLVEVVPIVNGLPFTTPLGSSAALTIPYADANGDNIIDGSNPPLAASAVRMYTLNTTVNRWELLPTAVDSPNKRATGVTPHFSVFALFAPTTIGAGLSGVKVYPVPWKPGTGSRFDAPGVTFANLPTAGTIRILDVGGARVREFSFSGAGAGVAVWDGQTDHGRRAASGVYFARVTSSAGGTLLLKFAIER
ncbi:MAG: fibronectin type III domain-containing protein, partial [Elusimicrobia bacterium]|nr:fibronectin type III domain-containing protein [Elusimicrobiota bacterium]